MKLYEPSMLDKEIKEHVLPTIEDLEPKSQVDFIEDIVFQKKSKITKSRKPLANWVERTTSKQGKMILPREGRGKNPSPHSIKSFGDQNLP
jgi:hypothetical protein